MLPVRVVIAVLLLATGLLALVVVVGVIRDNVDTEAIAVILSPIITGIIVGGIVKSKDDKDEKSGGSK